MGKRARIGFITRVSLHLAWMLCDELDKSTEYMIQFMQDTANVDHDTVMDFLQEENTEEAEQFRALFNDDEQ